MRRNDFETDRYLATMFYSADDFNVVKVLSYLEPLVAGKYDGEMFVYPEALPEDAGSPQIVMRDKSNTRELRISPNRADLTWEDGPAADQADISKLSDDAGGIFEALASRFSFRVRRLGCGVTRKADTPAPLAVSSAFLKEDLRAAQGGPFDDAFDIHLHVHRRLRYSDWFDVDGIVEFYGGAPLPPEGDEPEDLTMLFVDQELNTPRTRRNIDIPRISEFFRGCEARMEDIFRTYLEG